MYIMTLESISTAYFINQSHQSMCLYVYPFTAARQLLGRQIPMATNSDNNRRIVGGIVGLFHIKGDSVGLLLYPPIVARQWRGKHVPVAIKNC
jgi:hypothetical protein